jgi:uncharacterized protein (UPF0332 family)
MRDWKECKDKFISVKITPDKQKAKSLIETSKERIETISREFNEKSANYIFEDYYTSILELLQAINLLKGYNVKNHICLGFYLRDILNREDLYKIYDDLRFKRNSLVYYGKRMEFSISKDAINKSKLLIKELNSLIKL